MTETLYLQLPRATGDAHWLLVDAFGNRIGRCQTGSLTEVTAQTLGRQITVLVPGSEISLLYADVPTRNTQKLMQALPYALEDRLAEDVESLHFAIGPRTASGYSVASMKRALLTHWLTELADAGIKVTRLIPDMLALPRLTDALTLALDQGEVIGCLPNGAAFRVENTVAPLVIERQLAAMRKSMACERAILHCTQDDPAVMDLCARLSNFGLATETVVHADGLLPFYAETLRGQSAINLLQGSFARQQGVAEHWRRWRVAIILFIMVCVAGLAQQTAGYIHLRQESARLDAEVLSEFHRALPDVHRVVDPRAQIQQRLNQLAGGNGAAGVLPLLADVGKALHESGDGPVQLTGLDYRGGTLQIQVQAKAIQSLDTLRSALQQNTSLTISLDSVNSANDQATGRLTITGGAS